MKLAWLDIKVRFWLWAFQRVSAAGDWLQKAAIDVGFRYQLAFVKRQEAQAKRR